jgi:hypothetical protein
MCEDVGKGHEGGSRTRSPRTILMSAQVTNGSPRAFKIVRGDHTGSRTLVMRAERFARTDLDKAELHFAGFADHMLVPGRIPDQLNISFVNAGNGKDL